MDAGLLAGEYHNGCLQYMFKSQTGTARTSVLQICRNKDRRPESTFWTTSRQYSRSNHSGVRLHQGYPEMISAHTDRNRPYDHLKITHWRWWTTNHKPSDKNAPATHLWPNGPKIIHLLHRRSRHGDGSADLQALLSEEVDAGFMFTDQESRDFIESESTSEGVINMQDATIYFC